MGPAFVAIVVPFTFRVRPSDPPILILIELLTGIFFPRIVSKSNISFVEAPLGVSASVSSLASKTFAAS